MSRFQARMPLITVVMPAYQAAGTIEQAITSVRAQTFSDWELVVVDDGSADATAAIAERQAEDDRRIKVMRLTKNVGAAAAMNQAWKAAASGLIAILDADDLALPHRLAVQVEYLSSRPTIAVLGGAAHFVDAHGIFLRTVSRPGDHADLARRRWYVSPFVHSTVAMRRSFLEATGGYMDGLRLGEDYDLWMRGFHAGNFTYANLPEPLVVYRARRVQSWAMIQAGAKVRMLAGRREHRSFRGRWAAARHFAEGLLEQTGIFSWRDRRRSASPPRDLPGFPFVQ